MMSKQLESLTLLLSNLIQTKYTNFYVIFQAYSEWVTYTLSGVTSAIYHSCDAGGWCALSYDTLQVCLIDYPPLLAYCTLTTDVWHFFVKCLFLF